MVVASRVAALSQNIVKMESLTSGLGRKTGEFEIIPLIYCLSLFGVNGMDILQRLHFPRFYRQRSNSENIRMGLLHLVLIS